METYLSFPLWGELLVIILSCIIVAKSYNNSALLFAIPLAIINTFWKFLFAKMGLVSSGVSSYAIGEYLESFTPLTFIISLVINYIISFLGLKIAYKITGNSISAIGYIIVYEIITIVLTYLLSNVLYFI